MAKRSRGANRGRVSPDEARLIELTLKEGGDVAKKQSLQRLNTLYRKGLRLQNPMGIKALILYNLRSPDRKVRRWAFITMAHLGDAADIPLLEAAWKESFSERDVFEAGLTTLARILPKDELLILLHRCGITMDPGIIMALAQEAQGFEPELESVRLNPDEADAGDLRLATLLVGLEKAPDTLFSDRHPVSSVLGELNTYDDRVVAQYSFWATVEHPDLGLDSVNVPPQLFSTLPANVQGWAYRVLTKSTSVAVQNYDFVVEGSQSEFTEVREGVAIGIRDIFYDSLDVTVIDWLLDENDMAIRERLLEHMATHATHSGGYREEVERAYRQSSPQSLVRARLEAACKDEGLSLQLRKIALQTGDPDLFSFVAGQTVTNNNTQNFNSQVNAGGISNSGTGASGNVQINVQQEAVATALELIRELQRSLNSLPESPPVNDAKQAVAEAAEKPTKGTVQKILSFLRLANEGATDLSALGNTGVEIYTGLSGVLDSLPPM